MKVNTGLKEYEPGDIQELRINGRVSGRKPLALFWTGSGIEVNVRCSELWLEVEVDFEQYEPWITVLINEEVVARQMLMPGRYFICLLRGMDKETVKHVQVIKETQPMADDPKGKLLIHKLKCDGTFLPVKNRKYKIEFVGDSITSGEGTVGAKQEMDWIPAWFSAINHYGYMTAKALNADYRMVSQSGWGVMTGWDNDPAHNIPDYYEKVCGLLQGEENSRLGAFENWDFQSWQPDVIVVNLGTNDEGAFHSPEWVNPVTGKRFKQHLNADGTYDKKDLQRLEEHMTDFLIRLRRNNPRAYIVWAYGMLGAQLMPSVYRSIDRYIEKTGDRKVSALQLPDTTEETTGARMHPGLLAHQRAARVLTEYLKKMYLVIREKDGYVI